MKILLVEDEEKLARFVELELKYEGYEVEKAFDGRRGLEQALSGVFDLILLDIMLPELSGTELLRRLRRVSQVPVIMLTARDGVPDKVAGLDLGADDYITKPFEIEELLARIRAALRRRETDAAATDGTVTCGVVTLDPSSRDVTVSGERVELTKREFDLLEYLMRNKNVVMSRDKLLGDVWDFDFDGGTNAVDVYVRFLRAKIDDVFNIKLIHTVRGVGYAVRDTEGAT
ncbi:MAG: response regulator transcription factor [Oscillospiraceae bacterium]|jgi:DNA-binding response OmpR family regulator|nr:response regulator transcription factor [Oscillospiraceae bacterium]